MQIYLITNTINEKCYIGKTCQRVKERWRRHIFRAKYNSNTRFHRAIRKYGKDAFIVQAICTALSEVQLNYLERYFISEFKSLEKDFGYNMTPGGEGAGKIISAETRKKMSEAHKNKPNTGHFKKGQVSAFKSKTHTEENKKIFSIKTGQIMKGNTYSKGLKHSEMHKKKIAESMKKSGNGTPALMGLRSKIFWDNITPEKREEFLKKREAARYKTVMAKKLTTQQP